MYTTAPLFGRFHSPLKKATQPLRRQPLHHLESLSASWIDPALLQTNPKKANSRERVYFPKLTFFTFLDQVLNPGSSCRQAVRQVQAYYQSLPEPRAVSADDSPYCSARARWTLDELVDIRRHIAEHPALNSLPFAMPLPPQCSLKVLDGTTFNLPDTPANRHQYPQSNDQRPECGFPLMRMVGVFCLHTGMLLERAYGPYQTSENALEKTLWPTFKPGDIVLTDRNFASWAAVASRKARDVDGIHRLHAKRSADFRQGRRLGPDDRLLTLSKPTLKAANFSDQQWEQLPTTLTVRLVRFRVKTQNGRCHKIILMTTLLDPVLWPVELLAQLYAWRWRIELFLRDIKTTLEMDMLSCRSPRMVHKELEMHLIAYNLIRAFMSEAALSCRVPLERLSFKGTLDATCQYAQAMARIPASYRRRRRALYARMLAAIASDPVPDRPDRFEPRCQKRRPKAFPFMTCLRRLLKAARQDKLPSPPFRCA